ncbi:MAG: biotin-dependent carboxyltransferase family protein [Gemmataceae bacterium]
MSLRILEPGLQTLVVDGGRPSSRSLGVPLGGAADRLSLAIGNALVGNPSDTAALECCLAGPTLLATVDVECVVFGAPFDLRIGSVSLVSGWTHWLRAGDVLRVGGTIVGARAYVCVAGGLQTPVALKSRSSLEPLARGMELPCPTSLDRGSRTVLLKRDTSTPIRAMPGPQIDWFDSSHFFGPNFEVSQSSNRMGLRLIGQPIERAAREMVSEPVAPGAVQVVNDGQCIVLGVDGQTVGGYPKVAQVIAADLDRLGQLRPGERVTFTAVSLEEAAAAYDERERYLREWLTRLSVTREAP